VKDNIKLFSEYRSKDYRTPRSMREAYGYDARIYSSKPDKLPGWVWWILVPLVLVLWVSYGWI